MDIFSLNSSYSEGTKLRKILLEERHDGGRIFTGMVCSIFYDGESNIVPKYEVLFKHDIGGKNCLPMYRLFLDLNKTVPMTGFCVTHRKWSEQRG